MRKHFIISILSLFLITACTSTGLKKAKTAAESEAYLKSVHSKILNPTTKNSQKSCVVETVITEKDWKKVVERANSCVEVGHFNQVERYGNHLAKEHHMGPWGAYFLSLAAESRGEMDRALWMVELGLKKTPDEGLLIYQKARLMWENKEFEVAVKLFEDAVKKRSDLLGARLVLGQLYYRDQEFQKAKKHFTQIVEMDSGQTSAWVGLAECELEGGNGEAALVALEKAIDLQPKNFDFRMREAFIYEKVIKNPRQALSAYKKIQNMGRGLGISRTVAQELNEKISQLQSQIAKETPGEQVSQRKPAKQEGVSK